MITGKLYKQQPSPASDAIAGVMTCNDKRILWWDKYEEGAKILCELRHPEIVSASSRGIEIRGWEPHGADKAGREILKYQEWWVTK